MYFLRSVFFLLAASSAIGHVKAHGYLESPRSRNYVAKMDGKWSGGDASTPQVETCPHCLNGGGARTSGQCGITGNTNYDFPPNTIGGVMPKNIQATYVKGQEIDVGVHVTAHHKGHFEFFVCPISIGEAPTRDCFWSHPLEFVKDLKYHATKDNNYPYRAYIPPSTFGDGNMSYRYRMKLPDDVAGDLVLLQWWWISANSCEAPGYADYNFPSEWGPMGSLSQCNILSDGTITGAEQFWNCAEVQIIDNGLPTPPQTSSPTMSPTPAYTVLTPDTANPTPAPTTSRPGTSSPTDAPLVYGNYCGTSWYDAGKCGIPCPTGNSTACGFSEHCYADVTCTGSTDVPIASPTSPPFQAPTKVPTKAPDQDSEPCGDGKRGNGFCLNPSHCCSKWGYCGSGEEWCGSSSNSISSESNNRQRHLRKQG